MPEMVRCTLRFPPQMMEVADQLARRHGITRNAAFIRAMGLAQVIDEHCADGYILGMVRDRRKLDVVIVSPAGATL